MNSGRLRSIPLLISLSALLQLNASAFAEQPQPLSSQPSFSYSVPLSQAGSGALTVSGNLGGVETEFLLDTGAGMVTVNRETFKELESLHKAEKVNQIGARMANGKIELVDVYRVPSFTLGDNCELGPIDVAVLKRGGRNLLGMNALIGASPFAVSFSPPGLSLSLCKRN